MKKQSIFRKIAVLQIVALAMFFAAVLPAPVMTYAAAAPTAISVAYYDGVYTRGFTWRTDQTVSDGYVQIVEKTGAMTKANVDWSDPSVQTVTAVSPGNLPGTLTGDTVNIKVWKAHHDFTEDAEGKTYLYRVGTAPNWSPAGEQKIDGGGDGVYLIHTTDPQGNSTSDYGLWAQTVEKAYQTHPQAQTMITTGDFTDLPGNNSTVNINHWNWALNLPQSVLMDTVMTPVAGNHDADNGVFAAHFNIYTPASPAQRNTGLWYSYDLGNVHIAVLNTQDPTPNNVISANQLQWLKGDLAAADVRGIEWKIVAQHVGCVSTGPQGADPNVNNLRAQLLPVMAEYKVDLVLQGHDHVYMRSNPFDWNNTAGNAAATGYGTVSESFFGEERSYMAEPGGTTYVVIATAAQKNYDPQPDNNLPEFLRSDKGAIATNPLKGIDANVSANPYSWFGAITIRDSVLLYETYTVNRTTGATALYDYAGVIKDTNNVPAKGPSITAQPQDTVAAEGGSASLTVTAVSPDDGTLSYQWYGSAVNSNMGGTAIPGAASSTYTFDADASSYLYYYVVVTNTLGAKKSSTVSRAASLTKKIAADALNGVTSPVAGQTPAVRIDDGDGYTATLAWQGVLLTFDADTAYTARITLKAKAGYTFAGYTDTASIAGFTVNGIEPVWVSNSGDTLVFNVTFTKTGQCGGSEGGCGGAGSYTALAGLFVLTAFALLRKKLI
ncbi:MAG: metallophosphoesterase [Firmicutes bacterium]|nr:metallophosphoesterase [Bacillota bacterium]